MAMGRERGVQGDLYVTWNEMPRSPGHVFYDRLQKLLADAGFDAFVEETCTPFYAPIMGAPSLPPGRYFRMHMVGYFEGIDSERGIVWRCSDSWSLRDFLRLSNRDKVPDHSWMSKTRSRLPHEVHETVFAFVLKLVAERGLVTGERIGGGGMRRAWLRGRENIHKRYLIHVAGFNLGILMRALFGCGTPKEAADARNTFLLVIQAGEVNIVVIAAASDADVAALIIAITPDAL